MRIPRGVGHYESWVKRSRFIAEARGVESRRMVDTVVSDLRAQHPGAHHVVYAFVIGDETSELLGMSDDGEPHGTAGRPVLDVLKGSGVRNCLITVVRYFGGTKLGTGGLVHAYGQAAKGCIATLSVEKQRDLVPAVLECPYETLDVVRSVMKDAEAEIVSETFGTDVIIECRVERGSESSLQERLYDVSRGTIELILE